MGQGCRGPAKDRKGWGRALLTLTPQGFCVLNYPSISRSLWAASEDPGHCAVPSMSVSLGSTYFHYSLASRWPGCPLSLSSLRRPGVSCTSSAFCHGSPAAYMTCVSCVGQACGTAGTCQLWSVPATTRAQRTVPMGAQWRCHHLSPQEKARKARRHRGRPLVSADRKASALDKEQEDLPGVLGKWEGVGMDVKGTESRNTRKGLWPMRREPCHHDDKIRL